MAVEIVLVLLLRVFKRVHRNAVLKYVFSHLTFLALHLSLQPEDSVSRNPPPDVPWPPEFPARVLGQHIAMHLAGIRKPLCL